MLKNDPCEFRYDRRSDEVPMLAKPWGAAGSNVPYESKLSLN